MIVIAVVGLFQCAPQPATRAIVPTLPNQSQKVVPAVDTARAATAKTAVVSDRLERQVESLKKTATELNDGMADAVLEADRLRKQKSATEAELQGLWEKLNAVKERNMFLELQADEAVAFANEQKTLRVEAEASLAEVSRLAAERDAEVVSLRLQHGDMAKMIEAANAETAKLRADLNKANAEAGIGKFVKGLIWTTLIMGGLALAVYVILRTYVPAYRLP
jgi:chromosome segregation ATPase